MCKIAYKGIVHERTEDAPFIGALILASTCSVGCDHCFNQYLKKMPTFYKTSVELIEEVTTNKLNEGIILAGLEWSEKPNALIELVRQAKCTNLKVMIYTGLEEEDFYDRVSKQYLLGCYIKFGYYDEERPSHVRDKYGVILASTNQYIDYLD